MRASSWLCSAHLVKRSLEAAEAVNTELHGTQVVLESQLFGWSRESELTQPVPVALPPHREAAWGGDAVTKEKLGQAVPSTQEVDLGVLSCTDEIPQRFVVRTRYPDWD